MFDSFTLLDWDGPSFGVGRRGRKLLERGDEATATIVGIAVSSTGSDDGGTNSRHYAYALDVLAGTGAPQRLGCRQHLNPHRRAVHLGSQVVVRHAKGRVIIDWPKTLDRLGVERSGPADSADFWKPLSGDAIPAPGVADREQGSDQRRIAKGAPARATVLRINELSGGLFGGGIENVDVDVLLTPEGGAPREALLRKIIAPDYAHHLLKVGVVLPVAVDRHKGSERITVDWVAAANGQTSVDASPPQATRDPAAPLPGAAPTQPDKIAGALGGLLGKALDHAGLSTEAPEGAEIPFETYVEVSARLARDAVPPAEHDVYAQRFGVPPGAWGPGSRAWQSRCARDWKLGAQYGQAYQDAFQRLG